MAYAMPNFSASPTNVQSTGEFTVAPNKVSALDASTGSNGDNNSSPTSRGPPRRKDTAVFSFGFDVSPTNSSATTDLSPDRAAGFPRQHTHNFDETDWVNQPGSFTLGGGPPGRLRGPRRGTSAAEAAGCGGPGSFGSFSMGQSYQMLGLMSPLDSRQHASGFPRSSPPSPPLGGIPKTSPGNSFIDTLNLSGTQLFPKGVSPRSQQLDVSTSELDTPDAVLLHSLKVYVPTPATGPDSMSSLPARFRKGPLVGSGAYSSVYVGVNMWTNELVAIKEITLQGGDDVKSLEEARREFELLRKLRHTHIVQYKLFEYYSHARVARIYLEYISGGTAGNLLEACGPLSENVVSEVARAVLQGLKYLHEKEILHRDIKPANILITGNGVVKLGDFGASKRVGKNGSGGDADRTSYVVVGTPVYMSPETIRGESLPECDIWSLGCTLHELLTGHHPWKCLGKFSDEQQLMGAILRGAQDPQSWKDNFPFTGMSETGQDFLRRCLVPQTNVRATCRQLLQHPWVTELAEADGVSLIKVHAMKYAASRVDAIVEELTDPFPSPSRKSGTVEPEPAEAEKKEPNEIET